MPDALYRTPSGLLVRLPPEQARKLRGFELVPEPMLGAIGDGRLYPPPMPPPIPPAPQVPIPPPAPMPRMNPFVFSFAKPRDKSSP